MITEAAQIWASFAGPIGNHLWQSTAFAAVTALLALALGKNHARVRHLLWLAASVKFLIPFAGLASVASRLSSWCAPAAPQLRLSALAVKVTEPFVISDAPQIIPATAATLFRRPPGPLLFSLSGSLAPPPSRSTGGSAGGT